jgi:cysteinyl-tRNA synthetase
MKLSLHNTLTGKEQPFKPLDRSNVRMYVCGPTVYDFAHIGNARPVIVFDVLFRLLRHLYGADHVTYVRNITDVDDKINARAAQEYPGMPLNQAIRAVTEKTERQFHEDVKALGCLPPNFEPRATEHIEKMKELIELIIKNKRGYVRDDHVLFRVKGLRSYGKLSHRSLEDMKSSARGEVAPKDYPADFVLWKPSKHGEPAWPSPAGIETPGRPGWHIECSAMSSKFLGERFDIHGGGIDLLFPHHENERAQSCRAFNKLQMARYWMHNGFLQVEGEKMAKSEDNFITIRELLDGWGGQKWDHSELRLLMLSTHYRQPLDWTLQGLSEARRIALGWKKLTANVDHDKIEIRPSEALTNALLNDLNTPDAIFSLHETARSAGTNARAVEQLYTDLVFLGLFSDRRAEVEREVGTLKVEFTAHPLSHDFTADALIKQRLENRIQSFVSSLDPTVNVISTSVSAASSLGFIFHAGERPAFLSPWTKYGPTFLSPDAKEHVSAKIGIEELNRRIEQRLEARKLKDFTQADRIRDELKAIAIALKDNRDGTTSWEVER